MPTPVEAITSLADTFDRFRSHGGVDAERLLGVGLVTAGPLDIAKGTVTGGPKEPDWQGYPLAQELAQAVSTPVFFDNSGTAAAIGERWFGAGARFSDFLLVCVGEGLGGGLVTSGHIHRGSGLNAGELGHIVVNPEGQVCGCGSRGCLETVVSLGALKRELGKEHASAEALEKEIAQSSPQLTAWLDGAATHLAQVLGGIDNLLDLDAIVLGGHVGRYPREMLEYLREGVEHHLPSFRMRGRPSYASVVVSEVEESGEALGAATLPIDHAFFPDPSIGLIPRARTNQDRPNEEGVFV